MRNDIFSGDMGCDLYGDKLRRAEAARAEAARVADVIRRGAEDDEDCPAGFDVADVITIGVVVGEVAAALLESLGDGE